MSTPLEKSKFGYSYPADTALVSTYGYLDFTPTESILNTDYSGQVVSRLIEQFKNKPNLKKILDVFVESFQELEYVYGDLYVERSLDESVGVQLDGIGDIVGKEREGRTDTVYREVIRFQTAVNMSSGEWEILLSITKEITFGTEVRIKGIYPAGVTLFSNGPVIPSNIISLLEESTVGGVKVEFTSAQGSSPIFGFAAEGGQAQRPDRAGFSEPTVSDSGGSLTEKFS